MRAVAINVGANTNEPGFRAPVYPDGSFEFVPIPESEPTSDPVPTYGDLTDHLDTEIPDDLHDRQVHFDPEFAEYPGGQQYTYGDPHGVKAGPLSTLETGDYCLFYATLSTAAASDRVPEDGEPAWWQAPEWGAYLIGAFRLASDPVSRQAYESMGPTERAVFASNAHVKRETFDAEVLLRGNPEASGLFSQAIPLSAPTAGSDANRLVTDLSADSGQGPWWRRPLRFNPISTRALLDVVESTDYERCFAD
jgi:hypothetical protein